MRGLGLWLEPGKPTQVDVKETALSDFFARLIVQPDKSPNLQDLVKSASTTTSTVAGATSTVQGATTTGAART